MVILLPIYFLNIYLFVWVTADDCVYKSTWQRPCRSDCPLRSRLALATHLLCRQQKTNGEISHRFFSFHSGNKASETFYR
uniref:Putative secreted protein n=1 Tax=Rhipicephalus microplus TaxID=6941 RepID=A0A6M2DDK8_RHIMP